MLKILTDYAKMIPENFSKSNIRNVIMLDLSQKMSNYARIMLEKVIILELCNLCQI